MTRGNGPASHLKMGGNTGFQAQFGGWIQPEPKAVSKEVGEAGAYWTSSAEVAGKAWHRDISTDSDVIIRTPRVGGLLAGGSLCARLDAGRSVDPKQRGPH